MLAVSMIADNNSCHLRLIAQRRNSMNWLIDLDIEMLHIYQN